MSVPDPPAVELRGVTKRYALYRRSGYRLLALLPGCAGRGRRINTVFEALDFRVERGALVGVVGKNGSGKTTLLRLIAGMTAPTAGRVSVTGSLQCLLALGAGFHPDFTGRENVRLNAALLAVPARDRRRFAQTVADFADLGPAFDEPLYTYSAGMKLRLGFAVMTQVNADLVLIDEVLAVGDAAFQQKCVRWLEGFARAGRTLVLVSHDALLVRLLCRRCVRLGGGGLLDDGDPDAVLRRYHADLAVHGGAVAPVPAGSAHDAIALAAPRLFGPRGEGTPARFLTGEELRVECSYRVRTRCSAPVPYVVLFRSDGVLCGTHHFGREQGPAGDWHAIRGGRREQWEAGRTGTFVFRCPNLPLLEGEYVIRLGCIEHEEGLPRLFDSAAREVPFTVGRGAMPEEGLVRLEGRWEHHRGADAAAPACDGPAAGAADLAAAPGGAGK